MGNDKRTQVIHDVLFLGQNPDRVKWQYFREGIEISPIYSDGAGCSAALLKYSPGSSVPKHEHTGYEHILILNGEQRVDGQQYNAGDLMISPPGSAHAISTRAGCTVLAIWEKPVRFINGDA